MCVGCSMSRWPTSYTIYSNIASNNLLYRPAPACLWPDYLYRFESTGGPLLFSQLSSYPETCWSAAVNKCWGNSWSAVVNKPGIIRSASLISYSDLLYSDKLLWSAFSLLPDSFLGLFYLVSLCAVSHSLLSVLCRIVISLFLAMCRRARLIYSSGDSILKVSILSF